MITIKKINEIYCEVNSDNEGELEHIKEHFSYKVEYYIPAKMRTWYSKSDGKKSLFNITTHKFFLGLFEELIKFISENNYEYSHDTNLGLSSSFSVLEAQEFIDSLNIPDQYKPREYQIKYFIKAVRDKRKILLSPTSSGKSLIMYLLYMYYKTKCLIIVPYSNLTDQLYKDFENYGCKDHSTLLVETWQSLIQRQEKFFQNFGVVICDEVHHARCDSITKIMQKIPQAQIRIGLTGTLSDKELDQKQIIGLFGPTCRYTTTTDLIEKGFNTPLLIKAIGLNHNMSKHFDYEDEMNYLIHSERRDRFMVRLALSLKGNTFLMFKNIAHGHRLLKMLSDERKDRKTFYVDGSISKEDREYIRQEIEKSNDSITLASTVFATGVNITSIHNIILAHPTKARVKILQSIGRGLRHNENKKLLTVFDIYDILKNNTTYRHYLEREKIYKAEGFPIKDYQINL